MQFLLIVALMSLIFPRLMRFLAVAATVGGLIVLVQIHDGFVSTSTHPQARTSSLSDAPDRQGR